MTYRDVVQRASPLNLLPFTTMASAEAPRVARERSLASALALATSLSFFGCQRFSPSDGTAATTGSSALASATAASAAAGSATAPFALPNLEPSLAPAGTGPRCSATDTDCEPFSGGASPNVVRPGYDPELPRRESLGAAGFSLGEQGAACTSDGECLRGGCGNHCVHWSDSIGAATCEVRSEIWDHYCGCFKQRCRWFTQSMERVEWESSKVSINQRPRSGAVDWPEPYYLQEDRGLGFAYPLIHECLLQNAPALPQQLQFVLEVDHEGHVQKLKLTAKSTALRECFREALTGARLLGARTSFATEVNPATLRGTLRTWVAQTY